jgi:hypothetical protein
MAMLHVRLATARACSVVTIAACLGLGMVLSGCNGGYQVDKYTVTDADREAAKHVGLGPDGKPLPGSTAALPRDPHDGAAYGPDGKPMGSGRVGGAPVQK